MKTVVLFLALVLAFFGVYVMRHEIVSRARQEADQRYYWSRIQTAADTAGLDPIFLASMVYVESKYNAQAVSAAGAMGLMQLMPATAREMGRRHAMIITDTSQLFDPDTNILLGALYMRHLIDRFGDTRLAVAAYNGGPSAVGRWLNRAGEGDTNPEQFDKEETRNYVRMIDVSYERLRRARGVWRMIREWM